MTSANAGRTSTRVSSCAQWGDEGHRKGWCLYEMGCKGPEAHFNCPSIRWNEHTSWPVKGGHGCIACAADYNWDKMSPMYSAAPERSGIRR